MAEKKAGVIIGSLLAIAGIVGLAFKKAVPVIKPFDPWSYAVRTDGTYAITGLSYSKATADYEAGVITEEQYNQVVALFGEEKPVPEGEVAPGVPTPEYLPPVVSPPTTLINGFTLRVVNPPPQAVAWSAHFAGSIYGVEPGILSGPLKIDSTWIYPKDPSNYTMLVILLYSWDPDNLNYDLIYPTFRYDPPLENGVKYVFDWSKKQLFEES